MLGKLFKYDMKSLARVFLPLYAALIVISVVNRILIITGLNVPIFIGSSVFGMMIGGVCVATLILTISRFRKNLLGREGYLSLTLPVSSDKLILSKLFSASIWFISSFIVVMLSILIIASSNYKQILEGVVHFFNSLRCLDFNGVIFGIDAFIIMILFMFCSIMLFYCCVSVSMLVNKHRKAFSFGAFIVITILAQIIGAIIIHALITIDPQLRDIAATHVFLGLTILGELLVFTIFYSTTRYMLTKRLNLE